jgi:peptidoglycan pentaglycine glycine transferase (the first glycine)
MTKRPLTIAGLSPACQLVALESGTWDRLVLLLPEPYFLQSEAWAQVKARYGWQPIPLIWRVAGELRAAALVLERQLNLAGIQTGLRIQYVPRGPLIADWGDESLRNQVMTDLQALARLRGAITVKIDAELPVGYGAPGEPDAVDAPLGLEVQAELAAGGWIFSNEQVQFRNTAVINLDQPDEVLLARMKQKTRYNIRLAERKGVSIRSAISDDFNTLYAMYAHTARRDGFLIREEGYYHTVWDLFIQAGMIDLLLAEVEGEPVAGLVLVKFGKRAWYLYGMSLDKHREKMPGYLLQWEAMCRAKIAGCHTYDLWGAPDVFDETDPMWGVYRFKQGLGCRVIRTLGAWDYPVKPVLYQVYTRLLPRLLAIMKLSDNL